MNVKPLKKYVGVLLKITGWRENRMGRMTAGKKTSTKAAGGKIVENTL